MAIGIASEAVGGPRITVQRVLLPWLTDKRNEIKALSYLQAGPGNPGIWATLMSAKEAIKVLQRGSLYTQHLKVTAPRAKELEQLLEGILNQISDIRKFDLSDYDVWRIQNLRAPFEAVLMSELGTMPIYMVSSKDAFDVEKLVSSGKELFPPTLMLKVPEASLDSFEAGKCLAFELNTACGFHTFRVVELVLRKYWTAVARDKEHPNPATIGNYAGQMKICGIGDEKVHEALSQLAKLHRNPISHPEVFLNSEEAIDILGMARSVIAYMLTSIPDAAVPSAAPEVTTSPAVPRIALKQADRQQPEPQA